jgi:glycerophosphoryl diester phosphodiesterase
VEVDLRSTRDGHLVAYHDPAAWVGGQQMHIGDHALADLHKYISAQQMPLAEEILAAARGSGLGLYLDIKDVSGTWAEWLRHALAARSMTARAIIASASPEILAEFSQATDAIPRAVLYRDPGQDPVRLARRARAHFVHPCWEAYERPDKLLTQDWLAAVRAQDLGITCWHEERPAVLAALRDLGVDGICTDTPKLLTEILMQ